MTKGERLKHEQCLEKRPLDTRDFTLCFDKKSSILSFLQPFFVVGGLRLWSVGSFVILQPNHGSLSAF